MGGKKEKIKKRLKNPWFLLVTVFLFIMFCINYLERIGWIKPLHGYFYPHYVPEILAMYLCGVSHYTWNISERWLWIVALSTSGIIFALPPTTIATFVIAVIIIAPYVVGFYIARYAYTHGKKKKKPFFWDDAGVLLTRG